jgi:hypothetical protein
LPKTTYCSNPALSEIPKIGGLISVTHYSLTAPNPTDDLTTAISNWVTDAPIRGHLDGLAGEGEPRLFKPNIGLVAEEFSVAQVVGVLNSRSDTAESNERDRVEHAVEWPFALDSWNRAGHPEDLTT